MAVSKRYQQVKHLLFTFPLALIFLDWNGRGKYMRCVCYSLYYVYFKKVPWITPLIHIAPVHSSENGFLPLLIAFVFYKENRNIRT